MDVMKLLLFCVEIITFVNGFDIHSQSQSFDITTVAIDDDEGYGCYVFPLEFEKAYLEALCSIEDERNRRCDNSRHYGYCTGAYTNLIGMKPPRETSIVIGKSQRLKFLLVEVHFGQKTEGSSQKVAETKLVLSNIPRKFLYQTYSLSSSGYIPENEKRGYFTEIACKWRNPTVTVYSFNPHTHGHGIMVEGFLVRNGTWILIGGHLQKTEWDDPITYPVISGPLQLRDGDILAARCLFRNDNQEPIPFGFTDEMCVFFLIFGYEPKHEEEFLVPLACDADTQLFSFCNQSETMGICPNKTFN